MSSPSRSSTAGWPPGRPRCRAGGSTRWTSPGAPPTWSAAGSPGRRSSGARSPTGSPREVEAAGGLLLPAVQRDAGRRAAHQPLHRRRAVRRRGVPRAPSTPAPTPGPRSPRDPTTPPWPGRCTTTRSTRRSAAWTAGRDLVGVMGGHARAPRRRGVRRRRPARAPPRPTATSWPPAAARAPWRPPTSAPGWPAAAPGTSTRRWRCSAEVPSFEPSVQDWAAAALGRARPVPRRRGVARHPHLALRARAAERLRHGDREVLPQRDPRGDPAPGLRRRHRVPARRRRHRAGGVPGRLRELLRRRVLGGADGAGRRGVLDRGAAGVAAAAGPGRGAADGVAGAPRRHRRGGRRAGGRRSSSARSGLRSRTSCPQAPSMSLPRVSRTVVGMPLASSRRTNSRSSSGSEAVHLEPGVGFSGIRFTCTQPQSPYELRTSPSRSARQAWSLMPRIMAYSIETRRLVTRA